MQGGGFRGWEQKEQKEKPREKEKKKKKQSRSTAELNRGSFPTSFLLLALYPVQQLVSFSKDFDVIYVPLWVLCDIMCAFIFSAYRW